MGCFKEVADSLCWCIPAPGLCGAYVKHTYVLAAPYLCEGGAGVSRGASHRRTPDRTGYLSAEVPWAVERPCSRDSPQRPQHGSPGSNKRARTGRPSTATGRAPSAPPTREVPPLPAAKMAPAASPLPLGGGPGRVPECGRGGRCGEARPPPPPGCRAALPCPAASRRGPGRLRGEAAVAREELGKAEGSGGVGAGRLRGSAGERERPRPASLPGQPLICGRRRCLGPPGSGAGCGAWGWEGRAAVSAGQGSRRAGWAAFPAPPPPRPLSSPAASPASTPCEKGPQNGENRLLRLRGNAVRDESSATCRRLIPEVVCGF